MYTIRENFFLQGLISGMEEGVNFTESFLPTRNKFEQDCNSLDAHEATSFKVKRSFKVRRNQVNMVFFLTAKNYFSKLQNTQNNKKK